jgi:hypothetical protein
MKARGYEIMAFEHLARDLGIARLVGANQSQAPQAVKKAKGAEEQKHQQLGGFVPAGIPGSWLH